MTDITIDVPVSELVKPATNAIRQWDTTAMDKWNQKIDAFYIKHKHDRHFWFFDLKFPTREDVERYYGKPAVGERMVLGTLYFKLFSGSRQRHDYENIVNLHKRDPNKILTMTVGSYNTLMTYSEVQGDSR